MPDAIYAEGLVKHFGDVRAVDGVDLAVPSGSVLGLLGPNGAGKTTVVRMLTTLLKPDAGHATVAGFDVVKAPNDVRRNIGLSGQFAAVDDYLTGRENLQMVGELYQLGRRDAKARAAVLLERFNLGDAADRTAKTYSGGMRRRLDLAAALIVQPSVMVMDEPTTGLDPRNRQALWEVIQELVRGGTTLLLTTQYLEEADHLAHDICVVNNGLVIARGTADQLKARSGHERVEVVVHGREDIAAATTVLESHGHGEVTVEEHTRKLTVPVTGGARLLADIIRRLDELDITIDDIGLRRPTLDDVFIALTGHTAESADAEDAAQPANLPTKEMAK
ncbi:ATP-binding cassette domain-containing protein [Streptomyces sp. TRM75563]|uniref:ATP-binding cassette domain-containing protein n=1 Tax=Streptomyces sp. TRM75563 TaxID=2817418 RepID=UPI001F611DBA|nr:ATP-binding cassette domain-containing protein [Streptomyces sp. TRM75563]MCI4040021.1 ATP-binding cassette domain-containing protein [Streptomyces sp. TRM75563]